MSVGVSVGAVCSALDGIAPSHLAESWDQVGLSFGVAEAPVSKLLVALDFTAAVLAQAQQLGAQMTIAYHPPRWREDGRAPITGLVARALMAGHAVASPHTAWDAAAGGANDQLATLLGLQAVRPLCPAPGHDASVGAGRIGHSSLSLPQLRRRLGEVLGLSHLIVSPLPTEAQLAPIGAVAVVVGAGGSQVAAACAAGAKALVTGEVRHHEALAAGAHSLALVTCLHGHSERPGLRALVARLAAHPSLHQVVVMAASADLEPLQIVAAAADLAD